MHGPGRVCFRNGQAIPGTGEAVDCRRGIDRSTRAYDFNLNPVRLPLAGIPLDRSRGRRQKGIEPLLDDGVAFAGRLLQSGPIDDLDLSSPVADKPRRLQRLRSQGPLRLSTGEMAIARFSFLPVPS
jgi:hypothetical protein